MNDIKNTYADKVFKGTTEKPDIHKLLTPFNKIYILNSIFIAKLFKLLGKLIFFHIQSILYFWPRVLCAV